ncbi:MAG: hypothetical protein R3292_13135 [Alcanivorax sp.]|nr:hypothetical protein [Alcanivorax sp.]
MRGELRTELVLRLAQCDHLQILKSIGYARPSTRNLERLANLLDAEDLGLNSGGYDFHFGDEGFLRAISDAVGIEADLVGKEIDAILTEREEHKAAFKPYLWVDTGFRRRSQPLFAMAACEQFRHLRFEGTFWRLPLHVQLQRAGQRVRDHMQETGGEVKMWGTVRQYWFFYASNKAYILSRHGDVIEEREGPVPSMSCASREMKFLLGEQS